MLEIPINSIDQDTLRNLIEEFVTRDGTDYGSEEASLEVKVQQVMQALQEGRATILFDELTESIDIQLREL